MKYKVHKIEQNYNQIWHGIKANKYIVVNYNFTIPNPNIHLSWQLTSNLIYIYHASHIISSKAANTYISNQGRNIGMTSKKHVIGIEESNQACSFLLSR